MENIITAISKFAPEDISLDYERLRTEGISHLEDLATYIWTDFNAHDPGITILEVLCYAITDLGYRANLPIEDILASGANSTSEQFFSATSILPICPVTQNDFRKVLIDFPGIRNAWVEKIYPDDVSLYIKKEKVIRSVDQGIVNNFYLWINSKLPFAKIKNDPYTINDIQDLKIRINGEEVDGSVKKELNQLINLFQYIGSYYKSKFKPATSDEINLLLKKYTFSDENYSKDVRVEVEKLINETFDIEKFLEQIDTHFDFNSNYDTPNLTDINQVIQLMDEIICRYRCFEVNKIGGDGFEEICLNGLYRICLDTHSLIEPDSKAAKRLIEKIRNGYLDENTKKEYKGLYNYRNLGEDYYDIQITPTQKICLCLDITIEPEADENEVMANALFRLQEFLTPTVQFQTFQQLLEKDKSCDEIFNGPMLCNGFIENQELEKAIIPEEIRLSDLYKIILETPHIETINGLKIKKKEDTEFVEDWCFKYREESENGCPTKPIIDLCCSPMCVRKNGITHTITESAITDLIELLRLGQRNFSGNSNNTPTIPAGVFRPDLEDYLSIQYEFPHNYAIGENGLPENTKPLRRAQVKQLQAYLLFYDQLLGTYLSQLSKVKDLLSVNQELETPTYFYQALYDVPGIKDLINDQSNIQTDQEWEDYQMDQNNFYIKKLKEIVEGGDTQFHRKHRLLNHLLTRFGEQFTDFVTPIFETREKHLEAKIDFLKDLPTLGLEKAKAYNYRAKDKLEEDVDVWNTTNVAGLKKRVYRLLGWGEATEESVFFNPTYRLVREEDRNNDLPYQFIRLYKLNKEGQLEEALLTSTKSYSPRKIKKIMPKLYVLINNEENYDIFKYENQYEVAFKADIRINKKVEKIQLVSPKDELKKANNLHEQIKSLINTNIKSGFHLIEHILLRPNDAADELLQMTYTCDLQYCPVDPYSFWLTVLVPAWKGLFEEEEYREYFMKLFRKETPAHIAVCFRWVEEEDAMENLEHALEQWREAFANCSPDECEITSKANELILQLNALPCDCYCSSGTSIIPKC